MSANSEIAPGFKEKIVFTIQNHNKLGTILAPCLVHVNKSGEFSYFNQRLHLHTIPKHLKALNEAEKQVFVLLDECADMHLIKKFSKKARTPAELYAELDEARMKALVIPYVQTRIDKSLIILRDAGVPLYYKGEKNEHVRSRPVRIIEEVAKAVFHFEKDATGSRYRMSLRYAANGPTTDLGSRSLVLVNKPGWLLVGDKVFQLEDGVEGMKAKPFFHKRIHPHSSIFRRELLQKLRHKSHSKV